VSASVAVVSVSVAVSVAAAVATAVTASCVVSPLLASAGIVVVAAVETFSAVEKNALFVDVEEVVAALESVAAAIADAGEGAGESRGDSTVAVCCSVM